jgi:uncharacterized protein with PIN domain
VAIILCVKLGKRARGSQISTSVLETQTVSHLITFEHFAFFKPMRKIPCSTCPAALSRYSQDYITVVIPKNCCITKNVWYSFGI